MFVYLRTLFELFLLWCVLPILLVAYAITKPVLYLIKLRRLPKPKDPKVIVITGASSGLGEALAIRYAGPGVTLALLARDAKRLEDVATKCTTKGATVQQATIDVTDAKQMESWLQKLDDVTPVDLIIANAGVTVNTAGTHRDLALTTRTVFGINVDGAFNTFLPLLERMRTRKSGQIALMGSIASYGPAYGMFAYCGSKAALRVFGEGLRWLVFRDGVHVNALVPGFIKSPMTEKNKDPMPYLMDMEPSVESIVKQLRDDIPVITVGWMPTTFAWILQMVAPPDFRETMARTNLARLFRYHTTRRHIYKKVE